MTQACVTDNGSIVDGMVQHHTTKRLRNPGTPGIPEKAVSSALPFSDRNFPDLHTYTTDKDFSGPTSFVVVVLNAWENSQRRCVGDV